jgi:hypothetical protein
MVLRREQTPSTAVTEPTSPLTRLSGSGHRGRLKKEAVPPLRAWQRRRVSQVLPVVAPFNQMQLKNGHGSWVQNIFEQ